MLQKIDKPLILIGSGGHAKVLLDTLLTAGLTDIIGITDADASKHGQTLLGVPIIGDDEMITHYSPETVLLVNGIGSVGSTSRRARVFQHFKQQGYYFASVIHPSVLTALLTSHIEIGEGVQILTGVILQIGCKLGDNTILNTRVTLDHDCIIDDHVHIAPGVVLSGNVHVQEGAHVGTGAIVIQGITIGTYSIVGAGAVVTRPVPAYTTVVGVPASEFGRISRIQYYSL